MVLRRPPSRFRHARRKATGQALCSTGIAPPPPQWRLVDGEGHRDWPWLGHGQPVASSPPRWLRGIPARHVTKPGVITHFSARLSAVSGRVGVVLASRSRPSPPSLATCAALLKAAAAASLEGSLVMQGKRMSIEQPGLQQMKHAGCLEEDRQAPHAHGTGGSSRLEEGHSAHQQETLRARTSCRVCSRGLPAG
ncbi:hypothetical protein D9Q98_004350 [Chlorella vulgaris]|uniref:Uncharacterized protein n=1 Tax=Chlorella vulgaris TaxID=3077 RepID=A0A9D4TPM2_CHLVU|nr:hypothetical protein D9Q98_004350 [Chlorella vulgaris]